MIDKFNGTIFRSILLTAGIETLVDNLILVKLFKRFQAFYGPESSLPCPQEPVIRP
jgi:hypothetical protein